VSVKLLWGSSQNVSVQWRISTPRKRAFFDKVKEITGA
jgi:hypothetical protein